MSAARRRPGRRRAQPTWWGFHRLADAWARRIVAAADVGSGDLVLDVGAGTGALTAPLVAAGARVIAVELDSRRARVLRDRFFHADVTVVRADGADLRLPRRAFRVVANPPFAITTGLLRRLLAPGSRLARADILVPPHVAARWVSVGAPGEERWGGTYQAFTTLAVPRRAFRPAAPTDAVVLRVERRSATGAPQAPRARRRSHGG